METRFTTRVVPRRLKVGDLVLRREDVDLKNAGKGKLPPNLEGPYRITAETDNGAYKLESLSKEPIPRT